MDLFHPFYLFFDICWQCFFWMGALFKVGEKIKLWIGGGVVSEGFLQSSSCLKSMMSFKAPLNSFNLMVYRVAIIDHTWSYIFDSDALYLNILEAATFPRNVNGRLLSNSWGLKWSCCCWQSLPPTLKPKMNYSDTKSGEVPCLAAVETCPDLAAGVCASLNSMDQTWSSDGKRNGTM